MNSPSRTTLALFVTAILAFLPCQTAAQTVTWGGTFGQPWIVPGGWLGGAVPGSSTNALLSSGQAILLPSNSGAANTLITNGNAVVSSIPVLFIEGGTLATSNAFVANASGSTSLVSVSSGSWSNSGTLAVGNSGTGTLAITGGIVHSGTFAIGNNANSVGTVTIGSGSLTGASAYVGNSGVGNMSINSTGRVTLTNLYIGNNASSSGSVAVTDGTLSSSIYVGYSGTGVLNLNSGATVTGGFDNFIAYSPNSKGSVTMSSGTFVSNDVLLVGFFGSGSLTVNGGYVNNGSTIFGVSTGGVGTGVISGGTLSNIYYFNVGSGSSTGGGNASVLINGGYVSAGKAVVIGDYAASSGTITVSSGSLVTSGSLIVGNRNVGVLNVQGGYVESAAGAIGNTDTSVAGATSASSGTANVTSGTWNITANAFTLGSTTGTGVLNINGGGVVIVKSGTGMVSLASAAGSVATLNFGDGGALNVSTVTGGSGTAAVNFTNSGTVTFAPILAGSLSVSQTGAGTTILAGTHTYTGPTTVGHGVLQVNGSIASSSGVAVSSGATLAGSGVVSKISGAGVVAPGDPVILTASQVDPSGGLGFDFHFSQTGAPNYGSATASGNDLLHLTGATPFTIALGSGNVITLDFTGLALQAGQTFYGGIFTDTAIADSMLNGATFNFTGLNGMTMQYDGLAPVADADFTSGTVTNGEVMKFEVTQPVPAAPAWALAITSAGLLIAARRRLKA